MDIDETTFKLSDCVEIALDSFSIRAAHKCLELLYLIQPDVPRYLSGDVTKLQRVLEAVINNVIDHNENGEVSVIVERLTERDNMQELHFAVHYSGTGTPQVQFNDAVDVSLQTDHHLNLLPGEPGQGLFISKLAIQMMGAELWVENYSEQGVRSCFTARFKSSQMKGVVGNMCGQLVELINKRVLIADENQTSQLILKQNFESWGMTPFFVESDEQVIDMLNCDPSFDLIILDRQMKGMGSIELGKQIKHMDLYADVPILILSSPGQNTAIPVKIFSAHLFKPVKMSALFENLLEVLVKEPGIPVTLTSLPAPGINVRLAQQIPLRILVVEDNQLNQKLVVLFLARMGYKAMVADNGLIAYELVKRETFDIIFMDVQMPEMDGIEATQAILMENFTNRAPRIIAITANTMQGDRERCLQSGMVDFLAKPVKIHEIQDILKRWS